MIDQITVNLDFPLLNLYQSEKSHGECFKCIPCKFEPVFCVIVYIKYVQDNLMVMSKACGLHIAETPVSNPQNYMYVSNPKRDDVALLHRNSQSAPYPIKQGERIIIKRQ